MSTLLSVPHPKFDSPDEGEFHALAKWRGHKDVALPKAMAGMHGYSFEAFGEESTNCLQPTPESVLLGALMREFPPSSLSGATPADKGLSFSILVKKAEEQQKRGQSMSDSIRNVKEALEKKKGEQPGSGDPSSGYAEDKLVDLDEEAIMFLAALSKIDKIKTMEVGTVKELVEDPEGSIVKDEPIETLDDITKLTPNEFADPLFVAKLATKDLFIEKRYREVEKQRFPLIFIDISGSMFSPAMKQPLVKAVLTKIFEGVKAGNTRCIVAFFERDITNVKKVFTAEQADKYLEDYKCPGGGNTEVNNVILQAHAWIKSGYVKGINLEGLQPEVLIINDGQDSVDPTHKLEFPVHAIMLHRGNPELKQLCLNSGGTFNVIPC